MIDIDFSSPLLNQLFWYYGTDKGRNGYSSLYECLFHDKRDKITSLLEIGIGTMIPGVYSSMVGYAVNDYKPGGSLRAWRDYFPLANIYGFDTQPDTQFSEERIFTMLGNSTNPTEIQSEFARYSLREFDIIIDDGDHQFSQQMITLKNFFHYVKPGGIYIIEDVCWGQSGNFSAVKNIVGNLPMFFLGPYDSMLVIANPIKNTDEFDRIQQLVMKHPFV